MKSIMMAIIVAFIIAGCKTCPVTVVTKAQIITPAFVCPIPADLILAPDSPDDYVLTASEKTQINNEIYITFAGFLRIVDTINARKGDDIINLKDANAKWKAYHDCIQQIIDTYKKLETESAEKPK